MRNELNYEMPWRPNYEARAMGVWIVTIPIAFWMDNRLGLPERMSWWIAALAGFHILRWSPGAFKVWRRIRRLKGLPTRYITTRDVIRIGRKKISSIWLGWGFDWQQRHAQLSHEIMKRDLGRLTLGKSGSFGAEWIHGLEPKEKRVRFPIEHIAGHTLIVGTTGAGKTRTFDLLITQAVLRDEAVIIIDPKGDRDLCEAARRACEMAGSPERFMFFHPALPNESFRLNPLLNFTRPSELASRIAQLIPAENGADPFKAFGQKSLDNIIQGLLVLDQQPTLISLRHYLEGGPSQLVTRSLEHHFQCSYGPNWMSRLPKTRSQGADSHALRLVKFYRDLVQGEHPNPNLEGLISMFEHDRTHFGKMVASLLPIMNILTTGALGELLSPNDNDKFDQRPVTDSATLINDRHVTYIGLDSLSDSMVGSAIGAILLADLASVAGKRYNFGSKIDPVNIFVDEAAEVINDPCIQLLNKGRGAMMRLFIATQTFADFVARTGSEAKARQILANVNNLIALRVLDSETQKYITDNLPLTRLRYIMRTQGVSTHANNPAMYSGNLGERLMEEEGELFPRQLLGMLPNLHFIAKLSGSRIVKGRIPILKS